MLFLYSLIVVDLNNITMTMIVVIHTCLISYYLRRICVEYVETKYDFKS